MANDEIKGEGYLVRLDRAANTVSLQGSLRLMDLQEYTPILALLEERLMATSDPLVVDVRGLQFINSAGIQMLLRLVVRLRETQHPCVIRATHAVLWQSKSLRSIQMILPTLQLQFD